MNNIQSLFVLIIFLNLTLIVNSSNKNNKLDEIEKRVENSGKLLQDFILFFDKRITWLEENMKGMVANYTDCCRDTERNYLTLFKLHTLVNDHLDIRDEF